MLFDNILQVVSGQFLRWNGWHIKMSEFLHCPSHWKWFYLYGHISFLGFCKSFTCKINRLFFLQQTSTKTLYTCICLQHSLLLGFVICQHRSTWNFMLHLCEGCLMFRSPIKGYFVLWQLSDWFSIFWQSQGELGQILNHANKWLDLLFVGWWRCGCYSWHFAYGWLATTCFIGLTKEIYLILLVLQLVIIQLDIALLGRLQQIGEGLVMITVVWLVPNNNDVICNDNNLFQLAKTLIKLSLEHINGYCSSKWHQCILESTSFWWVFGNRNLSLNCIVPPIDRMIALSEACQQVISGSNFVGLWLAKIFIPGPNNI